MWNKILDYILYMAGKPKALRLYQYLKHYASLPATTVCILHLAEPGKSCPQSKFFCGTESKLKAINFDTVKERYCSYKHLESLSSVDAVMHKGDIFLFVEIKSWKNFEQYFIKPTDNKAERLKKIEEKAKKFKLKKKVEESMTICCDVFKDEHLFDDMPVLYVLMTDIDTVVDPLDRFRARLGTLSYKAVNMLHFNDASVAELKKVGMDARYVCCREFDNFYAGL